MQNSLRMQHENARPRKHQHLQHLNETSIGYILTVYFQQNRPQNLRLRQHLLSSPLLEIVPRSLSCDAHYDDYLEADEAEPDEV